MNTEQEQPTNTASDVVSAPQPEVVQATPQPTPQKKNTNLIIAVVIALIALAGALYYVYGPSFTKEVVAVVNGEKIYADELQENMDRLAASAVQGGVDVSDPQIQTEIRNQSLQMLIDNALLTSGATSAGVSASEAEVEETYTELVAQVGGEEELRTQIELLGITPDELRENVYERVLVDNYIESVTDIENITVTDEDIAAFLAGYDPNEIPPLEEIRAEVEAQILLQKQQMMLSELIEELRADAEIEIIEPTEA